MILFLNFGLVLATFLSVINNFLCSCKHREWDGLVKEVEISLEVSNCFEGKHLIADLFQPDPPLAPSFC